MKPTRTILFLALALMLAVDIVAFAQPRNYSRQGNSDRQRGSPRGASTGAQSSNVPGPQDYRQFSSFITQRNIFDPSRLARSSPNRQTISRPSPSTPAFSLVGTMSYEKGLFAFFSGNNSNLRKVLYPTDTNTIAGFSVADITLAGVRLQSADKRRTVILKIGDTMRQEGSTWQLAGRSASSADTGGAESAAPEEAGSSSPEAAATEPGKALEANDILKKLMQQREQELK